MIFGAISAQGSFGHKVGMSHRIHSFHLRLPSDLKGKLESSTETSGRSLNREILDRLDRSFDPDPAMQLAEAIRPIIDKMSEQDQNRIVALFSETFAILSKKPVKR